jgi:type I restriction enzyme S subunit
MTSRAPVGNIAIAAQPMCTNQGFKSFVPKPGLNSLYLYFALRAIVPAIQKQSHGNTFTEITKDLIGQFQIPVPPTVDDQIAIAAELERKLNHVESMLQTCNRELETISALPGAILREAFDFGE